MNIHNYTCKILDFTDIDKLNNFIEKIKNTDDQLLWQSIKSEFCVQKKDFLISACLKNNEIVSCTLGYSINSIWNKNVIPYWIMGRYQSIESIDKNLIDIVQKKLTGYFESNNFSTFYNVFKLNKKLNYKNCEDYIYRFIEKSFFHDSRYRITVEKLLYHNFNYNDLPIFYKEISFKDCEKTQSIVIARYDLKYEFKNDAFINRK